MRYLPVLVLCGALCACKTSGSGSSVPDTPYQPPLLLSAEVREGIRFSPETAEQAEFLPGRPTLEPPGDETPVITLAERELPGETRQSSPEKTKKLPASIEEETTAGNLLDTRTRRQLARSESANEEQRRRILALEQQLEDTRLSLEREREARRKMDERLSAAREEQDRLIAEAERKGRNAVMASLREKPARPETPVSDREMSGKTTAPKKETLPEPVAREAVAEPRPAVQTTYPPISGQWTFRVPAGGAPLLLCRLENPRPHAVPVRYRLEWLDDTGMKIHEEQGATRLASRQRTAVRVTPAPRAAYARLSLVEDQ